MSVDKLIHFYLCNENEVDYELCMRHCFILAKSLDIQFNYF